MQEQLPDIGSMASGQSMAGHTYEVFYLLVTGTLPPWVRLSV